MSGSIANCRARLSLQRGLDRLSRFLTIAENTKLVPVEQSPGLTSDCHGSSQGVNGVAPDHLGLGRTPVTVPNCDFRVLGEADLEIPVFGKKVCIHQHSIRLIETPEPGIRLDSEDQVS
jgi:hypothetical protein